MEDVDKPGSDVDDYINNLDKLLKEKMHSISNLQNKIKEFRNNLSEEQVVNKKIQEMKKNSSFEMLNLDQDDELGLNENHLY